MCLNGQNLYDQLKGCYNFIHENYPKKGERISPSLKSALLEKLDEAEELLRQLHPFKTELASLLVNISIDYVRDRKKQLSEEF